MIFIIIGGAIFTAIGLFICVPVYFKKIKCKEHAKGKIVEVSEPGSTDQPIRAIYEYNVGVKSFRKHTGWTQYAVFAVGAECDIFYNKNKPQSSYMKHSGQVIPCAVGTIFAAIGVLVILIGVLLCYYT